MNTADHPSSKPTYYAVIFTSTRSSEDAGYAAMAREMEERARRQPGFLGIESARNSDGTGITVSYWQTLESIAAWKADPAHSAAQQQGKATWYESYRVRIARVERTYGMEEPVT